ncbi:isopenicillin N synthase family dioxygenase [Aquibaculum arenosum]|uniref:2-oxoglutarate-dependent ethylene/succinate-forming enzyme n=1 Tax=Aquibaculum arenosum TaxID=3032591 RepID=A0ABT5YJT5_9PROT|nr:2OG-Fe(II) oxygenase family protein [Fodinicurvata sp. CAU 1616]MDF2095206.1 2OG-Fe(II) oxygenase family protein [Fodinicurvata sp. CAU 1616]
MIPLIDIASLFASDSQIRRETDRAIMAAAQDSGFMVVTGLGAEGGADPDCRSELLRFFTLPQQAKTPLSRRKFAPDNPNVYRGYFPVQEGQATCKEGIDIGPDLLDPQRRKADDPLREATPLPEERDLPGWRASAADYFAAMEATGAALMASIARGLGLPESTFAPYFEQGISTLRLLRYPPRLLGSAELRDPELSVEDRGERRLLAGKAHVDSGFVTLLQQHGVSGLQAQLPDGSWHDVPPQEGGLVVNFGKLLERWTGGRIRATPHRILANEAERFSIPFFYEPAAEARIAPLPLAQAERFEPFVYGDHLWSAMTRFIEFQGLENLRPAQAA